MKPIKTQICVIGGGASGMMAAISAARLGATVTLLERMDRVGKKILATGNGRCNLTNQNIVVERYHGQNPKFIYGALGQFTPQQTVQFFEMLGIACKVEEEKIYPFSDQASSVLDVLRYEMKKLKIQEICNVEVSHIIPINKGFSIQMEGRKEIVQAEKVIVATGGKASSQLGSNGSGYQIVETLGHSIVKPFPALVQLCLEAHFLKRIKGVKFKGEISVHGNQKFLRKEKGEILFTDYGISGPPILQISRMASQALQQGQEVNIQLDLFPDYSSEQLEILLHTRWGYDPDKSLDFSFVGFINKRLIPVILLEAGIKNIQKPCKEVQEHEKRQILKILKSWTFSVKGTQSWRQAQVTAGGIDTKEVDPKTMESKKISDLYFTGEVIDIDGDCGGFNLQWAWSSGYVAGKWAATSCLSKRKK